MQPAVQLISPTYNDNPFFNELFTQLFEKKINLNGFPDAQKEMIIKIQFKAFESRYNNSNVIPYLITYGKSKAGKAILEKLNNSILLSDITILYQFRNLGIGGRVIDLIKNKLSSNQNKIILHVDKGNPALRLYQKKGFKIISKNEIQFEMEWQK